MDAKDDDYQPDLPPCQADYLLNYLFDVGPCLYGGMGPTPLTHVELQAWGDLVGIPLNGWEARTLRRLSMEYIGQQQKASAVDCAAPWAESVEARRVAGLTLKQSMKLLKEL